MTARQTSGLALGPKVRSQRADLKRRIGDGEIDAAALIAGDADEAVETIALGIPVISILRAVPGIGPATFMDIVKDRGVYSHTRLADLTTRTRRQIADHLRKAVAT